MDRNRLLRGATVLTLGVMLLGGSASGVSADESDNDANEVPVATGTVEDGQDLLGLAQITIDEAVAAAQGAANGRIGEVDLEYVGETLAFNVDVGNHDVKVDAATGAVLAVDADD